MDDDDDDVIVLPNEEPSVTEIEDDDEYVPESVPPTSEKATIDVDSDDENKKEEMEIVKEAGEEEENDAADADAAGSDVEIQEPHIPFTDLDTYVEKEQPEADETSQMSFMNVKIKEEPKDDDEDEDDGFEDVGTVVIPLDEEISIQSSGKWCFAYGIKYKIYVFSFFHFIYRRNPNSNNNIVNVRHVAHCRTPTILTVSRAS